MTDNPIDQAMLAVHTGLAPSPKRRPDGWATIVRGKVAAVGLFKPRGPGEPGWEYWRARGHEAPQPVYLDIPELSGAEVGALLERRRQVAQEGFTPEHDDQYTSGELARAAGCYALAAGGVVLLRLLPFWPWARNYLKAGDSDRCLDKAIALLLAEKERRNRALVSAQEKGG